MMKTSLITLTGSILLVGIATMSGCSDDTTSGGSGGRSSGGSSNSGGSAGSGTTSGGSGGSGTTSGGSGGSGTTSGGTGGTTGGTGTSGGSGGTDAAGGTGGGGACPGPGDFDDGDPCTFTGMCPSSCGIEELGSRSCSCATTADCDSCMPPDSAMYPITMPATACDPDNEDTIRDMPCDTEGAACLFTSGRGCVCWNFMAGATTWTCGSVNNWFAM